jgi:hypothetical protein
VRLPRKSEAHARGILRLGASLGKPLCTHFDATSTPLLEDSVLSDPGALMPLLERVNLNGCKRVQSSVVHIARECTNLTSLQCAGCPRLSDTEIVEMCKGGGSRLVHLDLSGCSTRVGDASARAIGLCTQLRELRLANSKKLTDMGIVSMLTGGASAADTARRNGAGAGMLTSLELSACEKITDLALACVAENCTQLLHLDLSISGFILFAWPAPGLSV